MFYFVLSIWYESHFYSITFIIKLKIFFFKGEIISENSITDNHIFIVKSGSCKVIKKLIVNKELSDDNNKKKEINVFKTIEEIFDSINNKSVAQSLKQIQMENVYIEIEVLKRGDVFGIRDVVFMDVAEPNSTMLLSCGVECLILNRKLFLKSLTKYNEMKLKVSLMPIPTEEELTRSYYEYVKWRNFKKRNMNKSAGLK